MPGESNTAMPSQSGAFGRRVVLPVAAIVAGTMATAVAFVVITSERLDALALDASNRLASTALSVKQHEIGRNLKDYAAWQDAYQNLHVQLNTNWAAADGNVGANVYNSLGYDMAFVVAPGERTVYAVLEGRPQEADAFELLSGGLDLLVQEARELSNLEPEPIVGLLRTASDVVIVAAASLMPPVGSAPPPPIASRSVLIFVKKLERNFLETMGQRYLLTDLHLLDPAATPPAASLPLVTPSGVHLGSLTWQPDRPGQELLRVLLPPLGLALIAVAVFTSLVLRHARRSAKAIETSAQTIEAHAHTLEASEARFRDVAEASSDWIWETDPKLRLTYISGRFSEVTGVAAVAVMGKEIDQFFSSDSGSDGWRSLWDDIRTHQPFRDLRCRYRDAFGHSRVCRLAGKPVLDREGTFCGYRGTAADITAEVEAQARAEHLALHDSLTGLPNRVLLRERLDMALMNARRLGSWPAVLCLDLDHFKEINDTLGHSAGDVLLQQVAERLQGCLRAIDTVARLGGDEFAIVQVNVNQPAETHALCRRLIECFEAPFAIENHELYVDVSIGVALAPHDGEDHTRLLKNADIALYRAKENGRRAFCFFEPEMDAKLQARKALEHDLRQALAKGELEMHYQPLVTLDGQSLTGVEALMRWWHPERGLVPPAEFIPVAEETGLIMSLGRWALRTACVQASEWAGLCVSVNLSPVQFKHRDLVGILREILEATGFEPSRLELEITEGVLLQDTEASLATLAGLKKLGVRIAMDDFGTGYSSLGYLHRFPFDKLKIDRSFISDLGDREQAAAIVKTIIALGQSLGMIINAEGVETLEQLTFLTTEGCDQVQGYYFGRPAPAEEIKQLIEDWQTSASPVAVA
jgi:diguanylate cyclase (GGDEF)-like protein/PAS domain S-box-containing protein